MLRLRRFVWLRLARKVHPLIHLLSPHVAQLGGELNDHTFRLVAFAEHATPLYVSELSHMLDWRTQANRLCERAA